MTTPPAIDDLNPGDAIPTGQSTPAVPMESLVGAERQKQTQYREARIFEYPPEGVFMSAERMAVAGIVLKF